MVIRRGDARDLAEVAAIQNASPGAAQWEVADYLAYGFRVASWEGRLAGFIVSRTLTPGEHEVLNLAVEPGLRGRGVGSSLVVALVADSPGVVFLEVRESNMTARSFYKALGFHEVSSRREYYATPPETAIVMKFHSC